MWSNTIRVLNSLDLDQVRCFVGPDPGAKLCKGYYDKKVNFLKKKTADNKSIKNY